ncbi:hypothetical protein P7L74_13670 [Tistrella mobilis]|jgi:hypothetical protein|uniref:hypothetical protein n=1 Tax=Tistrella mobilis TaxID=171437 RepID=UPI003558CCB5
MMVPPGVAVPDAMRLTTQSFERRIFMPIFLTLDDNVVCDGCAIHRAGKRRQMRGGVQVFPGGKWQDLQADRSGAIFLFGHNEMR